MASLGVNLASLGVPGAPPETHFGAPGHPRELEKVVPGRTLGTPQKKTSKMSPYVCKTLENAETVLKNRGPKKPGLAWNGKCVQ